MREALAMCKRKLRKNQKPNRKKVSGTWEKGTPAAAVPKQGTGGHLWLVASLDAAVPQRGGKSKNLPLNFFSTAGKRRKKRKKIIRRLKIPRNRKRQI